MLLFLRNHIVILFLIPVIFIACHPKEEKSKKKQISKETLIQANKSHLKTEDQKIEDYISRHKWEMQTTSSGLRYLIYQTNNGKLIDAMQTITYNYTLNLLNGNICYSSDDLGPKTITLGKGEIERGLEEGILLLKKGERAKFIIPSHLAFGLVGDDNRIPAKATLVYDIELIEF